MESKLLRADALQILDTESPRDGCWIGLVVLISDPQHVAWACKHFHPSRMGAITCAGATAERMNHEPSRAKE